MPDPKKLGPGSREKGLAGRGLQTLQTMSAGKVFYDLFLRESQYSGKSKRREEEMPPKPDFQRSCIGLAICLEIKARGGNLSRMLQLPVSKFDFFTK